MASITIPTFGGEVPRTMPRLLEITQASMAVNCQLQRGSLEPLAGPKKVADLERSSQTIFKHATDGWLSWPGTVDVVKSSVTDIAGETPLGHLFITGDRLTPRNIWPGAAFIAWACPDPRGAGCDRCQGGGGKNRSLLCLGSGHGGSDTSAIRLREHSRRHSGG